MKPLSLTQGKCTQLKTDLYSYFLVLQRLPQFLVLDHHKIGCPTLSFTTH